MGASDIAFPHLGIYLENVPKNFTVFGFTIALYGVIIALGIVAGINLAAWVAKKYGYDPNDIWDFAIYGVIFTVSQIPGGIFDGAGNAFGPVVSIFAGEKDNKSMKYVLRVALRYTCFIIGQLPPHAYQESKEAHLQQRSARRW